eukprot:15438817-Alexandrium_andersonii.AAC.1
MHCTWFQGCPEQGATSPPAEAGQCLWKPSNISRTLYASRERGRERAGESEFWSTSSSCVRMLRAGWMG